MPPTTWKTSANNDLNELLSRLAWVRRSPKTKYDMRVRLRRARQVLQQSGTTPSYMAGKVRSLALDIQALECRANSNGTKQES